MITKDAKNILVADDSEFFRTKLSEIIMEAGHNVKIARSGDEVIKELSSNPGGVDLLILDLLMPNIDGFDVLAWISENGYRDKFPVLVIRGAYESGHILENLKKYGATGFISKGFTPEHIMFRINRLLFPEKATGAHSMVRIPVAIPVDFTHGELLQTGFLLNLSETGTFIHTKTELPMGTKLRLKFALPGVDRLMETDGIVKWVATHDSTRSLFGGYGVMFAALNADDKELLNLFIASEFKKMKLL